MTLALGQDEISSSRDQTLPCERSVTVLALTAVTQPSTPPCLRYLSATFKDLEPWYLELMASAFSRNRRDRSYSMTPWSTRPMLFCTEKPSRRWERHADTTVPALWTAGPHRCVTAGSAAALAMSLQQ